MTSPVLRCHHISGSWNRVRTVITASMARRLANIAGNEKIRRRTLTLTADSVRSMEASAVFKPTPCQSLLVQERDLVPQVEADDAGKLARESSSGQPPC